MGPGDGNYDGNRYHKKPILGFGDFTDRFNANRMNRSQYAPEFYHSTNPVVNEVVQ